MTEEILREEIYYLSNAASPSEVIKIWNQYKETNNGKSLIISLDNYTKSIYPKELNKILNLPDSHFVQYFESDKLYFLDNELLSEMISKGHQDVFFPIDYSVMLDTNYSSYINNFVNNKDHYLGDNISNDVYKSLDFLLRYDFNFDHLFYIIENFKLSIQSNTKEPSDPLTDLRQNLTSLELFKNIDKNTYISAGKVQYKISQKEASQNADDIIQLYYSSCGGIEMMERIFLNIHKGIVLFLIGLIRIRFETKSILSCKMKKMFEYIDNVLGIYLEREMIVACKYLSNPHEIKIINKINKGMSKDKLYKNIENIAWDFTIPRIMEFFSMTLNDEGRFFIPFFLTNDFNLRYLLRLHKVKGLIYNSKDTHFIPISSINTEEYFNTNGCNVDSSFFSDESQIKRNNIYKNNKENGFIRIKEEFEKLAKVMNCTS